MWGGKLPARDGSQPGHACAIDQAWGREAACSGSVVAVGRHLLGAPSATLRSPLQMSFAPPFLPAPHCPLMFLTALSCSCSSPALSPPLPALPAAGWRAHRRSPPLPRCPPLPSLISPLAALPSPLLPATGWRSRRRCTGACAARSAARTRCGAAGRCWARSGEPAPLPVCCCGYFEHCTRERDPSSRLARGALPPRPVHTRPLPCCVARSTCFLKPDPTPSPDLDSGLRGRGEGTG